MSLQLRLNILTTALLLLTFLAISVTLVFEAGPRFRAESESVMQLSRDALETSIGAIQHAPDPAAALNAVIHRFDGLRHIQVTLLPPNGEGTPAADRAMPGDEPSLIDYILPRPPPIRLPVTIQGARHGTVLIASQSTDELAEIWLAISDVVISGLVLTAAIIALTHRVIRGALSPIADLNRAMRRMEKGDFEIGIRREGPPEIAAIAGGLNDLAAALRRAKAENSRLAAQLVRLQDDERRQIARELHDELGPYLFSVRAAGTSLKGEAERPDPDRHKVKQLATLMLGQIEAIQATNRRVLRRLTPVGLNELGLRATLEGVIATWRKEHAGIELTFEISGPVDELDFASALTVYRFVLEGLTNALRHARAHRVAIEVICEEAAATRGDGEKPETLAVRLSVSDDGIGIPPGRQPGFGLETMKERLAALGGTLAIRPGAEGGTTVTALLPGVRKGVERASQGPPAAVRGAS